MKKLRIALILLAGFFYTGVITGCSEDINGLEVVEIEDAQSDEHNDGSGVGDNPPPPPGGEG